MQPARGPGLTTALVLNAASPAFAHNERIHQAMTDYSHIRIDAKRQALDALDAARRDATGNGKGGEKAKNDEEIPAIVEVSDDLTSQSAVERVPALR